MSHVLSCAVMTMLRLLVGAVRWVASRYDAPMGALRLGDDEMTARKPPHALVGGSLAHKLVPASPTQQVLHGRPSNMHDAGAELRCVPIFRDARLFSSSSPQHIYPATKWAI